MTVTPSSEHFQRRDTRDSLKWRGLFRLLVNTIFADLE